MQTEQDPRILALLTLPDLSSFEYDEVEEVYYAEACYSLGSQEWVVLTEDEANDKVAEDIRESLWAFNTTFLSDYMPLDADMLYDLRGDRCEGANAAILALVGSRIGELITDAIALDGRGHFTNSYDGREYEVQTDSGEDFLAYRVN